MRAEQKDHVVRDAWFDVHKLVFAIVHMNYV
ncbi:MAG: hypothetical protein RL162_559, partial [Pseudomonadota bacterium]